VRWAGRGMTVELNGNAGCVVGREGIWVKAIRYCICGKLGRGVLSSVSSRWMLSFSTPEISLSQIPLRISISISDISELIAHAEAKGRIV